MKQSIFLFLLLSISLLSEAQSEKSKGKVNRDNTLTEIKINPTEKKARIPATAAEGKNAKGMEMKEKNEARREDKISNAAPVGIDNSQGNSKLKGEALDENRIKSVTEKKGGEIRKDKREKILTPDQK